MKNIPVVLAAGLLAAVPPGVQAQGMTVPRVPESVRDAAVKRKAELASMRIGVGAFRHLYSAKLNTLVSGLYEGEGEPTVFNFTEFPWKAGPNLFARDGKARFDLRGNTGSWEAWVAGEWQTYQAQVTARWIEGQDDYGFGLLVNFTPNGGNYYRFIVTENGHAVLQKYYNKKSTNLGDWVNVKGTYKKGQDNHLRVELKGGDIDCYLNGRKVISRREGANAIAKGQVGLVVTGKSVVDFDDLEIQKIALTKREVKRGSGYDYADEVIEGMLRTGLFAKEQIGISNFPPNEDWTHVLGASDVGAVDAGRYSMKVFLRPGEEETPLWEERVSLDWSGAAPAVSAPSASEDGASAGSGSSWRSANMKLVGEYLAFQIAANQLGIKAGGAQ